MITESIQVAYISLTSQTFPKLQLRLHLFCFYTDWSLDTSLFWKMKDLNLNIQCLKLFGVKALFKHILSYHKCSFHNHTNILLKTLCLWRWILDGWKILQGIFFIVLSVYLLVALLYYLSVCLSCCHSINNTEVEIGAITMIPWFKCFAVYF